MLIKIFEASNVSDAMKKVKKEFGSQAVIISTREKNTEAGKSVEIRAAIPEDNRMEGAVSRDHSPQANSNEWLQKISTLESKLNWLMKSSATKSQVSSLEEKLKELKLISLDTLKLTNPTSAINQLSPSLAKIYQQLSLSGIHELHLTELFTHLQSLSTDQVDFSQFESLTDYFQTQAIRWMLRKIKISSSFNSKKGILSVHNFVGPSGAGKTSSIIKMASHFKKEKQLNVALATFNNVRLASSETLRVFAKVIDIPAIVAEDSRDLRDKLKGCSKFDLVLIDNPGKFPSQEDDQFNFKDQVMSSCPMDTHLVLSLTEKEDQLDQAIRSYANLGLQSLIFTKLDSTLSYGEIYNLSLKWSLPVSFLATGEKIPDDIEIASREKIIEKIFRV